MILLAFLFIDFFFDPFFSAKMTNLKLSKQKKLMAEPRARCGNQSASKCDLTSIQTQTLKRRKMDVAKAILVISDPQPTSFLFPGSSK